MEEEELEQVDHTPKGRLIRRVNLDVQKAKLTEYFIEKGINSFRIVETPEDYYSMTLDQRKVIVGCNKEALCKSVILENTLFDENIKCPIYQKYYLTIVQYVSEFNAEKIARLLRSYIAEKYNIKISKKQVHFRVAKKEVAYEMTGFSFNSIGPYLMKSEDLLIIFPSKLYEIYPQYFFLGGGELELKVGVNIDDFMRLFGKQTLVIDTSPDK